jgi:serine/threonine protein phosphatase PrpC
MGKGKGKEQPHPRIGWSAVGQSVRGAAHLRTGLPNQDAIRWLPASGAGPPLILAVSDGHGSAKYFRSHIGSERAVETTAWLIQDLLDGQPDPANLSAIKRTAEDRLPQQITRRWKQAVAEHLKQAPLTADELGTLEQQDGVAARQAIADDPSLAYGATILAVLVAETFILYLQLGDGDMLVVAEDGRVTRPLERDARLFANQTTSLCSTDAWRDVQVRFQALVDPPPALILLATDGYANSFVNEAAFLQVGTDILEMIRTEGLEAVQESLETWLSEASQAGSGDDITLGILCRADVPSSSQADTSELKAAQTDVSLGEKDEFTVTVTVKRAPRPKKQ